MELNPVEQHLKKIRQAICEAKFPELSNVELANGFTQIANTKMANAIKNISAARGYDPQDYILVTFGGAGGQHACGIAQQLGIRRILCHPLAGILSAYGIGMGIGMGIGIGVFGGLV